MINLNEGDVLNGGTYVADVKYPESYNFSVKTIDEMFYFLNKTIRPGHYFNYTFDRETGSLIIQVGGAVVSAEPSEFEEYDYGSEEKKDDIAETLPQENFTTMQQAYNDLIDLLKKQLLLNCTEERLDLLILTCKQYPKQ